MLPKSLAFLVSIRIPKGNGLISTWIMSLRVKVLSLNPGPATLWMGHLGQSSLASSVKWDHIACTCLAEVERGN